MDRASRRDLATAAAIGVTIAVGTIGLGSAFAPGDRDATLAAVGASDRGSLVVPDSTVAGGGPGGLSSVAPRGDGAADGTAGGDEVAGDAAGSADAAPAGSTADRRTGQRPGDDRESAGTGSDGPSDTTPDRDPATGGTDTGDDDGAAGSSDGSGSGPDTSPPPASGDRAQVRLRVVSSSISGAEDDGLRDGTLVRLRVAATSVDRAPAAWTTGSGGPMLRFASTSDGPSDGDDAPGGAAAASTPDDDLVVGGDDTTPAPSDPDDPRDAAPAAVTVRSAVPADARSRFDVAVRLSAADARALNERIAGEPGRAALRSWVDLVSAQSGARRTRTGDLLGGRDLAVRVRMDLVSTPDATAPEPTDREVDGGVSNVVEVQTPLTTDAGDPVVPDPTAAPDPAPSPGAAPASGAAAASGADPDGAGAPGARPGGPSQSGAADAEPPAGAGTAGPAGGPDATATDATDATDAGGHATGTADGGAGVSGDGTVPGSAPAPGGTTPAPDAATPETGAGDPTGSPADPAGEPTAPAVDLPEGAGASGSMTVGATSGGGLAVVVALPDAEDPAVS
ncbi:MAG: hypothetical protein AB7G37_17725 [Solirubrobacteraceae bacterium]